MHILKKQLLILGNGFDLACGLESDYKSFFDWRLGNLMEYVNKEMILGTEHIAGAKVGQTYTTWGIVNNNEKYCVKDLNALVHKDDNSYGRYTIWDLFFLAEHYIKGEYKKLVGWCDIESFIEYVVKVNKKSKFSYMNKYIGSQIFHNNLDNSGLFRQLLKFEDVFKFYIKEQVNTKINNGLYSSNQEERFANLLMKGFDEVNILSFNYTPDIRKIEIQSRTDNEESRKINKVIKNYRNIHGNTGGNTHIIFGLDSVGVEPANDFYKFTKTYRIMANNEQERYIDILDGKDNIDVITFYGHSLAEADFSYFESIFDYYNIYDSKVRLEFYCALYKDEIRNKNKNEEEKRKRYRSICLLLDKYGKSIGGMRGENLIHKLLLENRLRIKYEKTREN